MSLRVPKLDQKRILFTILAALPPWSGFKATWVFDQMNVGVNQSPSFSLALVNLVVAPSHELLVLQSSC